MTDCLRKETVLARTIQAIFTLYTVSVITAPGVEAWPVVSLERLSLEQPEGGRSTNGFIVRRIEETNNPLTVYYTISGSAKAGQDFRRLPGVLNIPAGADSAVVELEPFEDAEVEGPETVTLTLVSNTASFTLAVLPDTQYYIGAEFGGTPLMFDRQTQWIADHRDDYNIAFVLHEGDITEDNAADEWPLAKAIISRLDGVVPYALAIGNHDGLNVPVGQTELFNQFFPVTNYQHLSTFGGVFESNRLDNTYHFLTAGGVDWMILSLEYGPRDEALAWANQIVTNHPNHRVIVLTHGYLYYDNTLLGTVPTQRWLPTNDGRSNNGTDIWNKFVRHHANISFVFCGHVKGDGTGSLVSTGDHGNRVYQMLACYQGYPYGGSGWMRIVRFDPGQDSVSVKTYSPYLRLFRSDGENDLTYGNLGIFLPSNLTYTVDPVQASATVTIVDNDSDATAPSIVAVCASDSPHQITVSFSKPVERDSAETVVNYRLSDGINIESAVLGAELKSVTLTTSSPLTCGGRYTLSANHIADRTSPSIRMGIESSATFYHARIFLTDSYDDESMRSWTVVDEGAMEGPSLWSVAEGKLRQLSNIYGPSPSVLTNRLGTCAIWNSPAAFAWSNYGFSAVFNTFDDDGIGVVFRYQDRTNYYKFESDKSRNFRQLSKLVGGVETILATESGSYLTNRDVRLQVLADTNRITVMLDGNTLFGGAITDASLPTGTVGLYCWGSEGVAFDDVRVLPLDSPSCLVLTCPTIDAAGNYRFTIIGSPALQCRVESAADPSSWTTLTNIAPFPGLMDFVYPPSGPSAATRFFRVQSP